ncbi:hypothetical protein [Gordonia soli]|uniref:Uncharacterized protein n=1 Tax=Gordonia soli NBRC 108243 TaxID=1223545 RepID=M0QEC6_9ACTN|nr:hypothetical protein [Gordonia soli]GAC66920.1 hypothetical protein GS4_05_01290 [Gordonia soli NBRC 108243]
MNEIPAELRGDLRRLIESEELGESFFGAAAARSQDEARVKAWDALHRLEFQTNIGVRRFVETVGAGVTTTNRLAETAGTVGGTAMLLLPWRAQMTSVRLGTHRYLPAFRRLAAGFAGTEHQEFFDYVVAHELAIIDFTERTLFDERSPLDAVHRLLDRPVPQND